MKPPRWVKDSERKQCVTCSKTFNFRRRRHHCRLCGEIFCNKCSPRQKIASPPNHLNSFNVRCCHPCHAQIHSAGKDQSALCSTSEFIPKHFREPLSKNTRETTFSPRFSPLMGIFLVTIAASLICALTFSNSKNIVAVVGWLAFVLLSTVFLLVRLDASATSSKLEPHTKLDEPATDKVSDEGDSKGYITMHDASSATELSKQLRCWYQEGISAQDIVWELGVRDEGWGSPVKTTRDGVSVWKRKFRASPTSTKTINIFKSRALVPASPSYLRDLLWDPKCQAEWNKTVAVYDRIEHLNEYADIVRVEANAIGPVSGRDFLNVRVSSAKVGGHYVCGGTGVVHPKFPPNKGLVRGWNGEGGFVFLNPHNCPLTANAVDGKNNLNRDERVDSCEIIWVMNSDLKGWLPRYLIESTLDTVLIQFNRDLRQLLADRKQNGDPCV